MVDVESRSWSETDSLLQFAEDAGYLERDRARILAATTSEAADEWVAKKVLTRAQVEDLRLRFQRHLRSLSSAALSPRPPESTTTQPPRLLGPYELRRELGRGAMGIVYKAQDQRTRAIVALKLLPPSVADDPVRRRLLLEEARKAALVETSPHVVHVLEAGVADGQAFLAMEFVDGEPLSNVLERGPLPAPLADSLMVQIVYGVDSAHSVGLIHRDLKPSNLMVTPAGQLKILDFGLAKDLVAAPSPESMDGVVGTPLYMAPEILRAALGLSRPDPSDVRSTRVDVYAIGLIACELFSGQHPSTPVRSYAELLERTKSAAVRARKLLSSASATPWRQLVCDMLAFTPKERPADARAVITSARQQHARPGLRPAAVAAIMIVIVSLFGGLTITLGFIGCKFGFGHVTPPDEVCSTWPPTGLT